MSDVQRMSDVQLFSPLLTVYSLSLHYSETASERHWTSRVFMSTANGSSVYLGGLHIFPMHLSSRAIFQCRGKDSRKSVWRR
jgi:hypothetical protein